MRYAAKVDANQVEIVAAIRGHGASVSCTHTSGDGIPDLLVGFCNQNFVMEIKDGSKPPSQRRLTKAQVKWHSEWKGNVFIIETIEHALIILNEIEKLYLDKTENLHQEYPHILRHTEVLERGRLCL